MSEWRKMRRIMIFIGAICFLTISLIFIIQHPKSPASNHINTDSKQTTENEQPTEENKKSPAPAAVLSESQQKAIERYNQGLKLYYERQFNTALTYFNQALSLDPNCYQALNGKGATYAFLGRYDEGIALIQKAIELKPDFVYAHFNLGLANELAGRWDTAIEAYQSAIRLDPKDVWSYYGIASIYGRQGNVEQVVNYLKQAIAIQPEVKAVAEDEKDFNPVKNDPRFQALLKSNETPASLSALSQSPRKTTETAPLGNDGIPVLYYHSVMDEPGNELRMPPQEFEEQMQYLSSKGYHTITPDQLYNALFHKGLLPEKPVLITFDDGYRDNFTNAFPIMQKYHFVGTVFMVSNFIDSSGFLTSDQLKQLQAAGWTIGGHTENHTDLTRVTTVEATQELKNSRLKLENLLGQPLKYFAYPFGGYNSNAAKLVNQDGYTMAFTTHKGWAKESDPYSIQRIYCYANMGIKEFERRLTNPNY